MTESAKSKLLELSAERANLTPEDVLNNLLLPEWKEASRMYDWRNHIDDSIRGSWHELSTESRLVAFLTAATRALDEEGWDRA